MHKPKPVMRILVLPILFWLTAGGFAQDRVKIANGIIEGTSDKNSKVHDRGKNRFGELCRAH